MTETANGATANVATSYYPGVAQFLANEAALLDENRLWDWYELLDDEFIYMIPIRLVQERDAPTDLADGEAHRQRDTKGSVKKRIERLYTGHAWAEDPPSRTVRIVGSIGIELTDRQDVLEARSSLLVYRERGQQGDFDLISGRRRDLIRCTSERVCLVSRTVTLAHTVLTTPNLGIFL